MDFFLGIRGARHGFVMLCCDTAATQQIITIKHDEDKLLALDGRTVMALSGEPGDRVQFSEFIAANVRLHALRTDTRLSTSAIAHYTRGELATALRKRPYQCNLLIAGVDDAPPAATDAVTPAPPAAGGPEGMATDAPAAAPAPAPAPAGGVPRLYWLDYLATMHSMNVAGTGYGSYFCLSLLDRHWRPDLTEAEALALMEAAVAEVLTRLVVAPPAYVIKVVDARGVRTLKTIRPVPAGGAGGTGLGGGAAASEMAAAPA